MRQLHPIHERYIQLVKEVVLNAIYEPGEHLSEGRDWPPGDALTMLGRLRLNNVEELTRTVLEEGITGDLIETGVWQGGACIVMAAVLAVYEAYDRRLFVADSFRGVPPVDLESYPADRPHIGMDQLARLNDNSVARVRDNFQRMGLLSEQVVFVEGWFKDTLPHLPSDRLAILRLDGDLYESTINALDNLYPKLAPGGFVIVDDMSLEGAAAAVADYRAAHDIRDPIATIDWTGVYWRKQS